MSLLCLPVHPQENPVPPRPVRATNLTSALGDQRLDNLPQAADIASDFVSGFGELGEVGRRHCLQETQWLDTFQRMGNALLYKDSLALLWSKFLVESGPRR